jgi:hypothetical protein
MNLHRQDAKVAKKGSFPGIPNLGVLGVLAVQDH